MPVGTAMRLLGLLAAASLVAPAPDADSGAACLCAGDTCEVLDHEQGVVLLQKGALGLRGRQREAGNASLTGEPTGYEVGVKEALAEAYPSGYIPVATSVWGGIAVTVVYFVVYAALAFVHSYNQANGQQPGRIERVLESTTSTVCFAPMLCVIFFAVYKRANQLSMSQPGFFGLPPGYVRVAITLCAMAFCAQLVLHIIKEWYYLRNIVESRASGAGVLDRAAVEVVQFWNSLFSASMTVMYLALTVVIVGLVSMCQPEEVLQKYGPAPVSAGTLCCILLGILYFAVYLLLHIAKSSDIWQYRGVEGFRDTQEPWRLAVEVLKLGATTMNYAPMLSVLFLGTQMSSDRSGRELPGYVGTSMYLCSFVMLAQVALVLMMPFVTGAEIKASSGRAEVDFVTRYHDLFLLISITRWAAMTALYVGVVVVCGYLWTLPHMPFWAHLLSHLSTLFFLVYLLLWVVITLRQWRGGGFTAVIRTLTTAKDTVAFCPMLAVLFLESWVHAGRLTTAEGLPGEPQGFAQDFMATATIALLLQLATVAANGLFWRLQRDQHERPAGSCATASLGLLTLIFYGALAALYISLLAIAVAIFTITPENAVS